MSQNTQTASADLDIIFQGEIKRKGGQTSDWKIGLKEGRMKWRNEGRKEGYKSSRGGDPCLSDSIRNKEGSHAGIMQRGRCLL